MEFSECHGENVKLADDRKSAKWKIKYSGGLIFSENDFQSNDVMNVRLNKSGHVDVGYCYVDPVADVDFRKLIQEMIIIKEIRVHKLSTKFELRRPTWDQIIFTINDERHENSLTGNKRVWILIYIKFGNLTVTIDGGSERCQRFHSKYDTNISLNSDRRSASLINPNPATVCCLSRKICQGETVEIEVNALQVNNKPPSRFHLVLGYSTLDPGELQDRDPGSFRLEDPTSSLRMDMVANNRDSCKWKEVKIFDKSDCEGNLSITFSRGCKLFYHHSVNGKAEEDLNIPHENSGVLLVFELWRTRIEIKSRPYSPPKHTDPTQQSATSSSKNLPDITYLNVGSSESTGLSCPSAPPLDIQSLTMSSPSSMQLDEVDAQLNLDPLVSTEAGKDNKELSETLVKKAFFDKVERRDMDREQPQKASKQRQPDLNQVSDMAHNESEYTQLLNIDLQQVCASGSNKEGVKETLDGIDETSHSHCSDKCTKKLLSESVQHHFTDILNLNFIELCDYLFQGEYLTRNEMEYYIERGVSEPIVIRRDFLINVLSKRPICIELLRYACFKSKQKHIFEKLSSKKEK